MSFQPPVIWNMSNATGYALQFNAPRPFMQAILRTAGECYIKPVLIKPSVAIATTSASVVAAGNGQTMVVASATGIAVGTQLTIQDGANTETVLVTALSGATVTADFANAHTGSGTAFAVQGVQFPAAPTGSPAPSAGAPRQGFYHMSNISEKYSKGLEAAPMAGSPLFAGAAADSIYGVLIWCVTAAELVIDAH